MEYAKIVFAQLDPFSPVVFYYELDERRKVHRYMEIHHDGGFSYATSRIEVNGAFLPPDPLEDLAVLNSPESGVFCFVIAASEFEDVWRKLELRCRLEGSEVSLVPERRP